MRLLPALATSFGRRRGDPQSLHLETGAAARLGSSMIAASATRGRAGNILRMMGARRQVLLGAAILALLQPAAAAPECNTFEAYVECGTPQEEFRNPTMDQGCDEFVTSAGFCVCTEGLCTDVANLIRIEVDCPPPGLLERASVANDYSRNCTSICAKHESNMWMFGVMSSCGASFATAAGLIIQKKSQIRNQELAAEDRPFQVGGFILAPLWVAGFLLIVLVPLPFNLMAVTWAAASLVAPLASVTLVLNQILAPALLGETLGRTDIIGTVVIVSGVIMATIFGSHCESSYTAEDLLELYTRTPILIVGSACFVSTQAIRTTT